MSRARALVGPLALVACASCTVPRIVFDGDAGPAVVDGDARARRDVQAPPDVPARDVPDVEDDGAAPDAPAPVDAPMPAHVAPRFVDSSTAALPVGSDTSVTLDAPSGAVEGDVLVAALALGTGNAMVPVPELDAPDGWTLLDEAPGASSPSRLAVYVHVATAAEPTSYAWSAGTTMVGGVGWITAYRGVDAIQPVDDHAIAHVGASAPTTAPGVTTTIDHALLVAIVAGHSAAGCTWTPPDGATERVDLNNGGPRSGTCDDVVLDAAGPSGTYTPTPSVPQDSAVVASVALRPAR